MLQIPFSIVEALEFDRRREAALRQLAASVCRPQRRSVREVLTSLIARRTVRPAGATMPEAGFNGSPCAAC